jgi:hypothetical protein
MMSKINKKVFSATVFAVITTVLIVSLFLALPASTQPSIKQAVPESQFNIDIAYAYVGPVPTDKESYFSTKYNQTMIHDSKYPSAVFLNFTRVPGIQIGSCDAVIQVYGIKVTTDTGIAEYHAWSAALTQRKHENLTNNFLISYLEGEDTEAKKALIEAAKLRRCLG